MPPLLALTDNFSSADSAKWYGTTNPTCNIVNGQLVITPDSAYDGYYSVTAFDMTGKCALGHVLTAATNPTSPGTAEGNIGLDAGSNNTWAYTFHGDGTIDVIEKVNNVSTRGPTIAWPGAVWLRIRELAGTVYWEYSFDCINWVTQWSKTWTIPAITSMHPYLQAGYYAGTPVGMVTFDAFDLPTTMPALPWFRF